MRNRIKYKCPCCGYKTLSERRSYDICPVCFWEDNAYQEDNPEVSVAPNSTSLNEAKVNFLEFGACDIAAITHVRKPTKNE